MKRKRDTSDEARKLLGFWEGAVGFGDPVGCVATTFTFDAPFFEEECLGRFAGIESNPREDSFAYIVEREERLSQIFACVLVDRSHVARQRSLRWHLLPIEVPNNGIQHAKVSLLVWERRVRLLVSSANLTEPGYRSNLEQMAALDFTPEGDIPLDVLREAVGFLERIQEFTPQAGPVARAGPVAGLREFLGRVRKQTASWADPKWPRGEERVVFLPVLPEEPSLFAKIQEHAWSGPGASEAWILSPFYDTELRSREVVDALVEIMAGKGERLIRFHAPGRRLPDGTVEIDLPECLRSPWSTRRTHEHRVVLEGGTDAETRALHAKGLWLERDGRAAHVLGSSNFTSAGTGVGRATVNIEANLAFVLPNSKNAFARSSRDSLPPSQEVDATGAGVTFIDALADRTPEKEESVPLPPGFGQALYVPEGDQGRLLLHIGPKAPETFDVLSADGARLLAAPDPASNRAGAPVEVPWLERRPPSYLLVRWRANDGAERQAIWVVNVTDTSRLPAPDELRNLALEELLEILTSARPLHEVVGLIMRRRERAKSSADGPVLDPHKRVDTRNFLIRRVRRVSAALEGLRYRLERPVSNIDALRWRLHGPVGPVALAKRLAENEGQGAAFMIAEVALTTRQVNWAAAESTLGTEAVAHEVKAVASQLRELAAAHPSPSNLRAYVQECFAEAVS